MPPPPAVPGRSEETAALSGPQRAAVLMLALGEGAVRTPARHDGRGRDQGDLAGDGATRRHSLEVVEKLCQEFVEHLGGSGNLVGSFENTERMLLRAMPRERVAVIMEEIRARPDVRCGTSSATCMRRCWRTISRTNIRRPLRWC